MKYLGNISFNWFETLLTFSGTTVPLIRKDVKSIKEDYILKNGGMTSEEISSAVCKELIGKCTIKAAGAGGITSVPATIPGIGTIGTIILGATADMTYLIKLHLELCYAISAAYDVNMEEEELKAVTLAILGFTGSSQALKGISAGALKKSVDEIAQAYITKGLGKSSAEVAERMMPRLLRKTYKFIPFLSIPIGASINAVATITVGKRAKKYFSEWHENPENEELIECEVVEMNQYNSDEN